MCEECRKKRYMPVANRPAKQCGHPVHQQPMQFCVACAKSKKVCASCGKPLT